MADGCFGMLQFPALYGLAPWSTTLESDDIILNQRLRILTGGRGSDLIDLSDYYENRKGVGLNENHY